MHGGDDFSFTSFIEEAGLDLARQFLAFHLLRLHYVYIIYSNHTTSMSGTTFTKQYSNFKTFSSLHKYCTNSSPSIKKRITTGSLKMQGCFPVEEYRYSGLNDFVLFVDTNYYISYYSLYFCQNFDRCFSIFLILSSPSNPTFSSNFISTYFAFYSPVMPGDTS